MRPGAGRVTFVVDRGDEPEVVADAFSAHDRTRRQITVHPTAGTRSQVELAADVLRAAGIATGDLARYRLGSARTAFAAAAAWLAVDDIDVLIVLRAHLLNRSALPHLAALAGTARLRTVLVWHAKPPRSWADLIPDHPAHLISETDDITHVLAETRTDPSATAAANTVPDGADPFPPLPTSGLAHFLADAHRTLGPAEFAAVDTEYQAGLQAACRWLSNNDLYRAAAADTAIDASSLLPAGLADTDVAAAVALLRDTYTPRELASLTEGLLCLGRPGKSAGLLPVRFSDLVGLQTFLSEVAAAAPSPGQAIAGIRGAQAGLLLHGLLLQTPSGLADAAGPGLTTGPFTGRTAAQIKQVLPHPCLAAAITATALTGRDLSALKGIAVETAPHRRNTLVLRSRWPSRTVAYAVPPEARQILEAARIFTRQTVGPGRPLLAGITPDDLTSAAAATGLGLPDATADRRNALPWHALATAWWIGDPLHSPGVSVLDAVLTQAAAAQ